MDIYETVDPIQHNGREYEVTQIVVSQPVCNVLFAAGRGGSPNRHLPLLRRVAGQGCTIIAPHFDMITSVMPNKEELDTRLEFIETAINRYAHAGQPIVGIGHSIGTTLLLILAGGKAITFLGQSVMARPSVKFNQLVLLAPPVDFFVHPEVLASVKSPVYLRTGSNDTVTPSAKALLLKENLEKQNKVKFILDEEAGHFSYMDELPPNVADCQPNRDAFLSGLADSIAQFITCS